MPTIYGRILFPVSLPSLSSLYCISIPGPSRIYSYLILICICLLYCFTWLLFLLHESMFDLPRASKYLEDLILFDTKKLPKGHAFDLVYSPLGQCFPLKTFLQTSKWLTLLNGKKWEPRQVTMPVPKEGDGARREHFAFQLSPSLREHYRELVINQHQPLTLTLG